MAGTQHGGRNSLRGGGCGPRSPGGHQHDAFRGFATLASALITRTRFGKPDASLSANGWVGGLVASSAGCAFVIPAAAVLIGLVAGALVTLSVEWLELHLHIDDPGGAISVHGMAGIWG